MSDDGLRLRSARGRGTLLACVLASGMAFLDNTVVTVALPHIGVSFHATVAGLQWTVTGYTLALAALVLLGGALGDRHGRRLVFLTGVVWFTLASVLCGLSLNVGMLIGARALQGVGAALLTPGSLALLQASFAEDDRAKAIGAWSGLSGVSTALGPFLGGWLIDALSWRWIFFLNVPLAALAIAATLAWVPESRAGVPAGVAPPPPAGLGAARARPPIDGPAAADRRRFDLLGASLGAAGLAGVTYGLIQRGVVALVLGLAGLVALVAFVLVERRRGERAMLPPRLFAVRAFSAINLVTFFIYAGISGVGFFLVVQLQVTAGLSAFVAGVALLPMTVLLLVGSAPAGALGARIGARLPLTVGSLVAAAGILLLLRVGPHASYFVDVLPAAVLFGLGMTLVVAPLTATVLAAAPGELAGAASGVNNAVARAAGLLAIAALPAAVGLSGSGYADASAMNAAYHRAMWWCAGLYAIGALASATLVSGRNRRTDARQRPGLRDRAPFGGPAD